MKNKIPKLSELLDSTSVGELTQGVIVAGAYQAMHDDKSLEDVIKYTEQMFKLFKEATDKDPKAAYFIIIALDQLLKTVVRETKKYTTLSQIEKLPS